VINNPARIRKLSNKAKDSGYAITPIISHTLIESTQDGIALKRAIAAQMWIGTEQTTNARIISRLGGKRALKIAKTPEPFLQDFLFLLANRRWRCTPSGV
jgi:hypothetical protein